MQRITWIDNSKAILIFLVVLAHFQTKYGLVPGKHMIYAFHVPAFLFITGFLVTTDFGKIGFGRILRKPIAVYVRAYAFFSVISIFIWWAGLSILAGAPANPLPALWGAVYGVGGAEKELVHVNTPLWYFPFLVTSFLGAYLCARLPAIWMGWAAAMAYAAFAVWYDGPRLPWCLDIGGIGTLVLFAGVQCRKHYHRIERFLNHRGFALLAAVLFFAMLVAVNKLNWQTNLNRANMGRNGIFYIAGIAAGTGLVISLGALLPSFAVVRTISANTLTIFATHMYLVRACGDYIPQPASEPLRIAILLGMSVAIVLICTALGQALQPVLNRLVFRRSAG